MQKILEGDLAGFAVPDLLSLLHMGQRTGVFVLERPDEESKLFVSEGRPVFAVATRSDLRLGAMLVRMGRLKEHDLQRVLARQEGTQKLGEMLLTEKILTEEELASFLKVQVSEVIFDTFTWRQGAFAFYDHVPPPSAVVTLDMDLQNLLMEGVRRIDERGKIEEIFPDRGMAVEAMANPERVKHSVTLTPEEWQVFFLVDGRRTVDEICRLVGNPDELITLRVLYRLVAAKFVALVPPKAERAAPASESRAPAGEKGATQALLDGKPLPAAPATPYSIEFQPAGARKPEDDTREIVSPKAVQYQKGATQLAVSRLVLMMKGDETSFPLVKDTYTLGRHRNNDIVISDPKVSSFHARLDRTPEGFRLVDLKSRNGCWVNGKRLETALLKTGDEVRLGPAKLTYKVDYSASVA